jgi:hypothetical protein
MGKTESQLGLRLFQAHGDASVRLPTLYLGMNCRCTHLEI